MVVSPSSGVMGQEGEAGLECMHVWIIQQHMGLSCLEKILTWSVRSVRSA